MKITKNYIQDNLIRKDGFLNNHKLKSIKETPEELYLIYNECSPRLCYCGKKTKFYTFNKGYQSEHCSIKCAHNKKKDVILTKEYIIENLITIKGELDSGKCKYYKETPSEMYNILHNIKTPKCICGKELTIKTFTKGYGDYCSQKCHYSDRRNILVSKGLSIPLELMSDFELYKRQVDIITKKQSLGTLNNFNKRGSIYLNKDAFHLDHRYSIREGFLNNIPAYIIGNIANLEMIPASKNCSKQADCSITIEELSKNVV